MAKVARLVGLRAAFSVLLTCVIWLALPIDQTMRALLTLLVWSPASALAPMYTQMSGGDGGLAGFANALTIILGVIAATFIALTLCRAGAQGADAALPAAVPARMTRPHPAADLLE